MKESGREETFRDKVNGIKGGREREKVEGGIKRKERLIEIYKHRNA